MTERKQEQWEQQLAGQPLRNGGFTSDIERRVGDRIQMGQTHTKSRGWMKTVAAMTAVVVLLGGGWLLRDDIGQLMPNQADGVPASLREDPLAGMDVSLKVMVNEIDSFTSKSFLLRHPTVDVETVVRQDSQRGDKLEGWIAKEQPDVLRLNVQEYAQLANEGKLLLLDSLIKKDKIDVDAMYQPIVELLREGGGGQLYGLTAGFQSQVLFVNAALFEKYGVPLPNKGMTWDELLNTAAKFQGTGVSGLLSSPFGANPSELARTIGYAEQLQLISGDGKSVTADSSAWASVWRKVAEGYRDGWLYRGQTKSDTDTESFTPSDPFIKGEVAMTISSDYYMSSLDNAWAKDAQKRWVTVPLPGTGNSGLFVHEIYAVSASTANEKAAWELVKFMTSSEFVKGEVEMGTAGTPIRPTDYTNRTEDQIGAFYEGKLDIPKYVAQQKNNSETNGSGIMFANAAISYAEPLLDQVITGTLTAEQALAKLQEQLELEALRQVKEQ